MHNTRRDFMKASLAATVAISSGSLLAACGSDDKSSTSDSENSSTGKGAKPSTSSAKLDKLTAMMPFSLTLNFIADVASKSGGFMADHGVDLDLQFARTAPQAMQQLAAGKVSVIRTAPIAIAQSVSNQGASFVSIGMPVQQLIYVLVSTPDKPYDTLRDLEGKTVGMPQLGSNAEQTFDLVLKSAKVDPTSVKRQAVGNETTSYAILEAGRVDAVFATREATSEMKQAGLDPHVAEISSVNPLLGNALATTREQLKAHRETMVGYLKGLADAFAAIRDEDRLDTLLPVIRKDWDLPELDHPDKVKPTLRTISDMWYSEDKENLLRNIPENWEKGVEVFKRLKIVGADAKPSDFYTNELWDEAFG